MFCRVPRQRLAVPLFRLFERDDPPICEELGEGAVQHVVGLLGGVVAHQVDRHVVGGPEGGGQVVRAGRGEPRDALERHLPLVDDDGVPEGVDPPPARATRELGVLPRRHGRGVPL